MDEILVVCNFHSFFIHLYKTMCAFPNYNDYVIAIG